MMTRLIFAVMLETLSSAGSQADRIDTTDLTPKFLTFYKAAVGGRLNGDARFALWKKDYGFAAVPPGPEGDAMARKLLDDAWPRYAKALPKIEQAGRSLQPSPELTLTRVKALLRPSRSVHMKLIVYVGAFEGNAFSVGKNGVATVAVPVEMSTKERGPVMTHEFVHAVQISMGTMSGGWKRTIGETVLAEGLAMRATQHIYPKLPATTFVETPDEPGWLKRAERRRSQILRDVRMAVSSSSSDDVLRFTMGKGPSGIDREAYFAGWAVVGYWLSHGMTYADIARIPEQDAPTAVAKAIDALSRSRL